MRVFKLNRGGKRYWLKSSNYSLAWSSRIDLAASLIAEDAVIAEFGCGPENNLGHSRFHFKSWQGFDLHAWNSKVSRINLNEKNFYNELNYLMAPTIIVLLGVLEYLKNPSQVLGVLAVNRTDFIVSYCHPNQTATPSFRKSMGWLHELSEQELLNLFEKIGYIATNSIIYQNEKNFKQVIYKFSSFH